MCLRDSGAVEAAVGEPGGRTKGETVGAQALSGAGRAAAAAARVATGDTTRGAGGFKGAVLTRRRSAQ